MRTEITCTLHEFLDIGRARFLLAHQEEFAIGAGWREFQFIDVALAAILFVIGLGLWMYRVMGGGDVKLLAATVLAIGSQSALPFAFALLAAGMLWLMAVRYWLILDYYLPLPAQFRDAMSKRRVPYAVCIAIAAFVAMAMDWRG